MVHCIIGIVIISSGFVLLPAHAAQNTDQVKRLEARVTALQSEVSELKATALDMQKILRAIAEKTLDKDVAATLGITAIESCENRLFAAQATRDKLAQFGYNDRHPDMTNIRAVIVTLKQECTDLAAAAQH